jgi:hypothetical protein
MRAQEERMAGLEAGKRAWWLNWRRFGLTRKRIFDYFCLS